MRWGTETAETAAGRRAWALRDAGDAEADRFLSRLWIQACISDDRDAKDVLVFAQGRGRRGLHEYETFLARRTAQRERAERPPRAAEGAR